MTGFDYDLFVIGGGSGGVRAARVAAASGARVGLAEDSRMGGTCVIRGCVPKKLMVFASAYRETFADARAYGWDLTEGPFDWARFSGQLNAELDRLEGVYRKLLAGSGVEVFDQRARLADAHTVALADGRQITAKHILIATGGRPVRPDMPNAQLGMVSDDIFHMSALPRSILIVGGGYIACEFAGILNGLGVAVTQFYRGTQILRGFDTEARDLIALMMREKGVDLRLGTDIDEMAPAGGGAIAVRGSDGSDRSYDAVLFATGRRPNTTDLGLEDLGVALGRQGEIVVDAYSQTNIPSVYAIGDVTDRVTLTPVAIREAMAFVETVFHANPTPVDHALIASAVFTQPEFGTIGLSEEAARAQEPVEIYATGFRPMQSAFAGREDRVLMKLVISQATRKVLGCHIVAPGAGEMIQLAAIAIKMGATKEDFDRTVAVHPTMAEELVTMKTPVRMA
jgi:glutathione reductase (NADPH)